MGNRLSIVTSIPIHPANAIGLNVTAPVMCVNCRTSKVTAESPIGHIPNPTKTCRLGAEGSAFT